MDKQIPNRPTTIRCLPESVLVLYIETVFQELFFFFFHGLSDDIQDEKFVLVCLSFKSY